MNGIVNEPPAHRSSGPRPVVVLYSIPWDWPARQIFHHLTEHFAKKGPVLYIEGPPNPLSFLTRPAEAARLLGRAFGPPREVVKNIWIASGLYALPYRGPAWLTGGRWVNSLNQLLLKPRLGRLLRHPGFRAPIIVAGGPQCLPVVEGLDRSLLVYHCTDDFTRTPGFPESFARLEEDFAKRCDLVVATSEQLRRAKAHLNPNCHTVSNAADPAHFARAQDPDLETASEIRALRAPVIGYIGCVDWRLDYKLIEALARARPGWSLAFIGPGTPPAKGIRSLSNVHWLGPRPYAALPAYLKGFSAAIAPFIFHVALDRSSHVKFYEYLASGVPIVSSRNPELEAFRDHAEFAGNPEEFERALLRVLNEDTPDAKNARMRAGRENSWESRFSRIDELIEQALRRHEADAQRAKPRTP